MEPQESIQAYLSNPKCDSPECAEDWAIVFEGKHVDIYNSFCLMYQFQLDIPGSAFDPVEANIQNNREAPDKVNRPGFTGG